jgi:hypothetical protein
MKLSRADLLRRRIAFYRRSLHEGLVGSVAILYLRELDKAEAELAKIERFTGPSSDAAPLPDKTD